MFTELCMPSLLTLLFGVAFVLFDLTQGNPFGGVMRGLLVIFFTLSMQLFCQNDLEWLSWTLIAIPFVLFSIIVGVIIFFSELDQQVEIQEDIRDELHKRKCPEKPRTCIPKQQCY